MMDCLGIEQLQSLVTGNVSSSSEDLWTDHLETCVACQKRLEQQAGGTQWLPLEDSLLQTEGHDHSTALEQAIDDLCHELMLPDSLSESRLRAWEAGQYQMLDASDQPGYMARFGRFYIEEVIGRGGMGLVVRAFDPSLERTVAVKILAPHLATLSTARKRFVKEARAAARVQSDHAVTIHAVDEVDGYPYLVMRLVKGESLQQRIERVGSLPTEEVVQIGLQVSAALAAAHAAGVVHRDVKPANVLIERETGRIKISDFGLARVVEDDGLTRTGFVLGTPHYMAPEQGQGLRVDFRADLYSLGAMLHCCCTGSPPFQGSSPFTIINKVIHDEPPCIRDANAEVPRWLESIVQQLMAKDPSDRLQSAEEVAAALRKRQEPARRHSSSTDGLPSPGRSRVALLHLMLAGSVLCFTCWLLIRTGDPFGGRNSGQNENLRASGSENRPAGPTTASQPLAATPADPGRAVERKAAPDVPLRLIDARGNRVDVDSLAAAVEQATPGSVILLSDRRFVIDAPLATGREEISIKAMPNASPEIVLVGGAVHAPEAIRVDGPVVLEGLSFRYVAEPRPIGRRAAAIRINRAKATLRNCAVFMEGARQRPIPCLAIESSEDVLIQNCVIASGHRNVGIAMDPEKARVGIENSLIVGENAVSLRFEAGPPRNLTGMLRVRQSTLIASSAIRVWAASRPVPHAARWRVQCEKSVLDVDYVLSATMKLPQDLAKAELIALDRMQHRVAWTGHENIFAVKRAYCGFASGVGEPVPAKSGPQSLVAWQDFCVAESEGSVSGDPVYAGPVRGIRPVDVAPRDYELVRLRGHDGTTGIGANTRLLGPATSPR